MNSVWSQRMAYYFVPIFHGMTSGKWIEILRNKQLEIDKVYWHRVIPTTLKCLSNSLLARIESKRFNSLVKDVKIKTPLFILGHWRSGTTYLHNLLSQDKRFAYPTFYQVMNPHTFLTTEDSFITRFFERLLPKERIVDNIPVQFNVPYEDEFIAWHSSTLTSYMTWNFPRAADYFDSFLTFRNAREDDLKQWKSDLIFFLKKLTYKYNRPIILKSPQHTCRIKILLEMFPDAKFIHIHRNPYKAFVSTKKLNNYTLKMFGFQKADLEWFDQRIIRQYTEMYDVFFEEKNLIPEGRFTEVRFEDLEKDPINELKIIYHVLNLPDFEETREAIEKYNRSLYNFKKNEYPDLEPGIQKQIREAWIRNFDEWGY